MSLRILCLGLIVGALIFAEDEHSKMDYGSVMSMTIKAPYPEDNNTVKAQVFKLDNFALPAKGTPVGKGRSLRAREDIKGTTLQDVYKRQREASRGYLIAVPDGTYDITLQFAEIKRKSKGERVFDITIQDKLVKEKLDVLAVAGFGTAHELTFKGIKVKEMLSIMFKRHSERSGPAIAGLIIKGKDFTKKINCGGAEAGDYEADWDKSEYVEDPYLAGMIFDTELMRWSAGWKNGFVELMGAAYDGVHGTWSETMGDLVFANSAIPGWIPEGKKIGVDPRKDKMGPLPEGWPTYSGLFKTKGQDKLLYQLDKFAVMELPYTEKLGAGMAFIREIKIELLNSNYQLLLAESEKPFEIKKVAGKTVAVTTMDDAFLAIHISGDLIMKSVKRSQDDDEIHSLLAAVPKGTKQIKTQYWSGPEDQLSTFTDHLKDEFKLKKGDWQFKPRHADIIETQAKLGETKTAFSVDEITMPVDNPWQAWMRPAAFDFFPGGDKMAMSTWSGDVWTVSGLKAMKTLKWQRIATGLYQPLGLKIMYGYIHTLGRDQITRLIDVNKDGEIDMYLNINNDMKVTTNFHEFAFELNVDKEGNFYFMKGAPVEKGGEEFGKTHIHHGKLMRVTKDGKKLEVVAGGLRAPNGMSMSPTGQMTCADNEGTWVPATPIHWLKEGGFYGVVPTAMGQSKIRDNTICFIPHKVDNSAGGQAWVPKGAWGSLSGELMHLSYGQAKVFHVLKEDVDGTMQGGVVEMRPDGGFNAGIMRGRFQPGGHLYVGGLQGWQTLGSAHGGLYRMRYNNKSFDRPIGLRVAKNGIELSFSSALDPKVALDAGFYNIEQWVYKSSEAYGSDDYKVPDKQWKGESSWLPLDKAVEAKINALPEKERENAILMALQKQKGHSPVTIKSISLSDDKKKVFLEIPDIHPVMQMHIAMNLKSAAGNEVKFDIYNTIHKLGDWQGKAGKGIERVTVKDAKPGLHLDLTHRGQQKKDSLVSRLAAFYYAEQDHLSPFLDAGPFDAQLNGFIKVDQNQSVRFYITQNGKISMSINGKAVDLTKDVMLKKGMNKILINYAAPETGDAVFRLYWQSEKFPKEPIPAVNLWHDSANKKLAEQSFLRKGRNLLADNNCFVCHKSGLKSEQIKMPELRQRPPSLKNTSGRLNKYWVRNWILNPKSKTESRMPHVLTHLNEKDKATAAADIAEYLESVQGIPLKAEKGDLASGEKLYSDFGCASCHSFKKEDQKINLARAADKFKSGAMAAFLKDPRAYNPSSRMPHFNLNDVESADLAAFVRSKGIKIKRAVFKGDVAKGKDLHHNHCMSCHYETEPTQVDLFAGINAIKACLSDDKSEKHPAFGIKHDDAKAILAFLKQGHKPIQRLAKSEFAERATAHYQCTNCHRRDEHKGNWVSSNQKPQEQPPLISHIGEKLRYETLANILAGKEDKMRPWMPAKMPSFPNHEILAQGYKSQHGFPLKEETIKPMVENGVAEGTKLSAAFNCVLCHAMGTKKALAPFGAPGLNLKYSRARLNYEYYQRWMTNPHRIDGKTLMIPFSPNNKTTTQGAFEGHAQKQYDAIWQYLESLK